jgi:hypothetical protein
MPQSVVTILKLVYPPITTLLKTIQQIAKNIDKFDVNYVNICFYVFFFVNKAVVLFGFSQNDIGRWDFHDIDREGSL